MQPISEVYIKEESIDHALTSSVSEQWQLIKKEETMDDKDEPLHTRAGKKISGLNLVSLLNP